MSPQTRDNLENLIVDRQDAVAIVTINRPRVLNALNSQTLDELGASCWASDTTRQSASSS